MATDVFAGVRLARSPVYGTKGMVVSFVCKAYARAAVAAMSVRAAGASHDSPGQDTEPRNITSARPSHWEGDGERWRANLMRSMGVG